jgi:chromosome segregation ATPase
MIAKTAVLLQSANFASQAATLVTMFGIAGTAVATDFSNKERTSRKLLQLRELWQQSMNREAAAVQQHADAVKSIKQRDKRIAQLTDKASAAGSKLNAANKSIKQRDSRIQELTVSAKAAVAERDTAVSKLGAAIVSVTQRDKRIQQLTDGTIDIKLTAAASHTDNNITDVITMLNSTVNQQAETFASLNKTVHALSNMIKWLVAVVLVLVALVIAVVVLAFRSKLQN